MLSCLRPRRIALLLGLTAALVAAQARAADTGNGSKNFRTPSSVPNYFSNEAGPLLGPAAETRRGTLYSDGTAAAAATSGTAAESPRARQVAMAVPRDRPVRGRTAEVRRGRTVVAHHVAVHGRPVSRVAAHASRRGHAEPVAARTRAVPKTTRIGVSAHRHARG